MIPYCDICGALPPTKRISTRAAYFGALNDTDYLNYCPDCQKEYMERLLDFMYGYFDAEEVPAPTIPLPQPGAYKVTFINNQPADMISAAHPNPLFDVNNEPVPTVTTTTDAAGKIPPAVIMSVSTTYNTYTTNYKIGGWTLAGKPYDLTQAVVRNITLVAVWVPV